MVWLNAAALKALHSVEYLPHSYGPVHVPIRVVFDWPFEVPMVLGWKKPINLKPQELAIKGERWTIDNYWREA